MRITELAQIDSLSILSDMAKSQILRPKKDLKEDSAHLHLSIQVQTRRDSIQVYEFY